MKVLVTGSAGFIGSHLKRELAQSGLQVRGCDINAYPGDYTCNVANPKHFAKVLRHYKPDVCVHLAAKVGRLFGEDDVQRTIADNTAMTASVAQLCGERNVRLMYASTSEVYGDRGTQICIEADLYDSERYWDPAIPHNAYGLSKRHGEEFCHLYAPEGLTILRFSMPYGPGLPAGRGRAAIINFLHNALHGLPIEVHRGSERSWCWVGDTVRAVRMLLEQERTGAYNVGRDDNPWSMLDTAKLCCDLAGASHDLIEVVERPARQTIVKRLSTSRLRGIGWEPHVSLEEGCARTLRWVREMYPVYAQAA